MSRSPATCPNPEDVEKLIPAAVDTLGKLDILVNNAGITRDNLAMRMKDEEWDAVIRVNLEAAFRLMRAAMRPMMKARFGRIITITSVVGATGNPGQMNYAAAKGGLTAMSKSLAQELASRGITVNCVAPGFIRTAMTDVLPDAQKDALNGRIPMGRMGEGEDIGAAVAYLASREAGYVTGQTLHVNGGMAMVSADRLARTWREPAYPRHLSPDSPCARFALAARGPGAKEYGPNFTGGAAIPGRRRGT